MVALASFLVPMTAAEAKVSTTKQIKLLKRSFAKTKRSFAKTTAELTQRIAVLEAKPEPAPPKLPTSLPPSGLAGGDLVGLFPNPLIGPDAVGGAEVADGSIGSADIAGLAIKRAQIDFNAVGPGQLGRDVVNGYALGPTFAHLGNSKFLQPGESGFVSATCPTGSALLSGGFELSSTGGQTGLGNIVIQQNAPSFTKPDTWLVEVKLRSEGFSNTINAEALCLAQ